MRIPRRIGFRSLTAAAIIGFGALALSAGLTFGQSGKKETMAVMEVEALPELGKKMEVNGKTLELNQVLGALNGAINQSFSATDKFTVVIRKNLKKFLEELALNGGGAEFTGAKYLVVTTLDNFEDNTARSALETGQVAATRSVIISGTAEIQNLKGELFKSVPFAVSKSAKSLKLANSNTTRDETVGEDLLPLVAREAANQIAVYVVSEISSPPEVLEVTDKQVIIDWGKGMPLAKGDVWEVCTQKFKTNSSGVGISIKKLVGKVTIQRVDADNSTGLIVGENLGIVEGCVLRKPQ